MSLLGRSEGLPARTVMIPVAQRRPPSMRRWLVGVTMVLVVSAGGAAAVAVVRGSHSRAASPPPAPAAPRVPRPRVPPAAVSVALAQQRAITRLEGLRVPVFCGAGRVRDVALTFDDGPGPSTARVLATLRRFHAAATFFLVGNRIRYWPRLPAGEATVGAVGDHTWSHADLGRMPRTRANREIDRARAAIATATSTRVRLFRTPYGHDPAWLGRALASRGMIEVRWSVDSNDYLPGTTPAAIVRRVAAGLHPGAIVIMHDLHGVTARALPRILRLMHARHLHAVTVPELLHADPPTYRQLMADNRGRACVNVATARRA